MTDLVVIVPGITGSALAVHGKPVWSLSGAAVMRGVLSLGKSIETLKLPEGPGDSLPISDARVSPMMGFQPRGSCRTYM